MSPIAIITAVLATLAASAAVLVGSAWLLVRAARARIEEQDRIAARVEALSAEPRASGEASACDGAVPTAPGR